MVRSSRSHGARLAFACLGLVGCQVIAGMDVVGKLTLRDPQANPLEPGDVINTVVIDEQ